MEYTTVSLSIDKGIAEIKLNRPKIRNAFNEQMIEELRSIFVELDKNEGVRAIFIHGKGKSFCAGADLNWMKDVSTYSYDQNLKESENLSACFHAVYACSKPTIALVHGAAIGGANGLLAACDIAVAETETVFSLSEVKIGIVPACISPYVMKRIGEFKCRETMLTGKRFSGKEAQEMGLVNFSGTMEEIEAYVWGTIEALKTSGPKAVSMCKELIYDLSNHWSLEEARFKTADMIAKLRQSEEGQEGMDAFLDKRKPNWVDKT